MFIQTRHAATRRLALLQEPGRLWLMRAGHAC